uniref:Response regulatory domain-containing protein n=1 Tax=uncultured Candidatus Melainabacteria bacterium TaxID=2682970 RepID=A0A650EJV3_9BACT|nr:hypothetical protein Melaina855_0990 [uncultured Candidatus Melainabacteria bacterium]
MKKILIVDDIPGWVRFHENNLKYLNNELEIDYAYSAKDAITKIEASIDNPYDVVFTDLQMESDFLPKLAGEWLIEQIKTFNKYYANCKIIIISASPSISRIAEKHNVLFLPKTIARNSDSGVYKEFIQ